ncbi:MAG: hypothetical protein LBC18_09055, partial [Opitutaceae bacterium]|nr:hypothetical protein [Opitutaceae bacterium]
PPPPPPPALPQVLNLLGIPKIYDNIATFFKLDLAKLSIPDIQARISLPLQPLAAVAGTLDAALTPGQAANAQTWAAAPQFFPALRLMETIDMGRLDFAPLKDLPPLDNIAAMTAFMQLGEAANSAPKGAAPKSAAQKDAASKSAAKCPQCPLR